MSPISVLSCSVALGIFVVFLGLALVVGRRKAALERRIDEYAAVASFAQAQEKKKAPAGGRSRGGAPASLDQYLRTELARADLALTVTEFILMNVVTTVLGFVLAFVIFRGNLLLAFLGVLVGFYGPTAYVRYSQGRRLAAFGNQIENTLVLLANGLRSGYGLMQAIEMVGKEVPPPTSEELGRVVREFALGVPTETALANLLRRNPSIDLDLVITAIDVNHETGGNLSEVLDTIASTIRDRVRIAGEIRALTAQQRFSAFVLTFLPAILGLVLFAMNPDYMSVLWQNTCGLVMLGTGLALMIIGNLIIRRIIAIRF